MTTVNNILDFLESITPQYMQYEWDNTGMLCGSRRKEVKKILVALDPFQVVCQEAADLGADLLLTHHPLIFTAPKAINDETDMGRAIMTLIRNNITAVNAHTNLDCAPDGVNDTLAGKLGLENIQVIDPQGTDENGNQWGLLRCGTVESQPLSQFLDTVKEKLGCKALKFVDSGKPVTKVAVGGGACAGFLKQAAATGCDTFVTADTRYNQFWDAKAMGIHLIDAGHFHTENPVCAVLAAKLQAAFPEICVVLAQNHTDCADFY